jgi:Glycosyl transferase family 2
MTETATTRNKAGSPGSLDADTSRGNNGKDNNGKRTSSSQKRRPERTELTSSSPVVALVVGRDPGDWFADTLASLAAQDHPAFSILVIDDGSRSPLQARVAELVPNAFVRRHDEPIGFSRCANLVQEMVSGAGFYLFCHDDVALAPDAVRLLVAESIRSGASIVGPKLVSWRDHDRLLGVGLGLDRAGTPVALVEPDERDQGQHDVAQEVVALSGAVLLVRADAFHEIGGFDPGSTAPEPMPTTKAKRVGFRRAAQAKAHNDAPVTNRPNLDLVSLGPDLGEDIDICWRARISGHVLAIEPLARVAHLAVVHGAVVHGAVSSVSSVSVETDPTWSTINRHRQTPDLAVADSELTPAANSAANASNVTPELAAEHVPSFGEVATERRLRSYRERNRVRSMLVTASAVRLPFITPILLLQTLWRSLSTKHRAAGNTSGTAAWKNAIRNAGELRARRRKVQAARVVTDRDDLSRLLPIGARTRAALRADVSADSARLWNLAEHSSIGTQRANRVRLALFGLAVLTWIVGSRSIVASGLPDVGQFMPLGRARDLIRATRNDEVRPPANNVLGFFKLIMGPNLTGLLVTVGMLILGSLMIWRLSAVLLRGEIPDNYSGKRSQLLRGPQTAITAAYVLSGLGINAIAAGRLDGAISYGLLPLVVSRILRAIEKCSADPNPTVTSRVAAVVPAAVVSAVMVAFAPSALVSIVVVALALAINGFAQRRLVAIVTGWLFFEVGILLLPWTGSLLARSFRWERITGGNFLRSARLPLDVLLRLGTGRDRPSVLAWGVIAVAVLPLVLSSEFRLRRAVLGWTLAVLSIGSAWLGARGWFGPILGHPTVALGPASIGLAIAAGIGAVAVTADLRSQKFGWRQGISILATGLFVLAAMPILAAAGNGRWMLPQRSVRSAVSWMASPRSVDPTNSPGTKGPAVWIGNISLLPTPGWMLRSSESSKGIAYAVAADGQPTIADQWLPPRTSLDRVLESALVEVSDGGTSRIGALAPGIRYFVLAERAALDSRRSTSLAGLRAALRRQFDLREVESPRGLTVFENVAWVRTPQASNRSRTFVIGVLRIVQVLAWLVALAVMAGSRRRRRNRELVLLDQERSFDDADGTERSHSRVGDFMATSFGDDDDDEFDPIAEFDEPVSVRIKGNSGPVVTRRTRGSSTTPTESTENSGSSDDSGLADELWDRWSARQDRRRQTEEKKNKIEATEVPATDERRKRSESDNGERRKR